MPCLLAVTRGFCLLLCVVVLVFVVFVSRLQFVSPALHVAIVSFFVDQDVVRGWLAFVRKCVGYLIFCFVGVLLSIQCTPRVL